MSEAWEPIEIHFKDGLFIKRFIMERSTIEANPRSLLVERLRSLADSDYIISFDRKVGMFKLIKQLMIYKDKVRSADVREVNRGQLKKELEYFKLENLFTYVENSGAGDFKHCMPCATNGSNLEVASLILKPTLVIYAKMKLLDEAGLSGTFNYKKYEVMQFEDRNSGQILMEYYVRRHENFCLRLQNRTQQIDKMELARLVYLFLVAVDRYDNEKRLLIGRNTFERVMGESFHVGAPLR